MRVVADSHAVVWYVKGTSRLSIDAKETLIAAEESEGIVVSVATLVDLGGRPPQGVLAVVD